MSKDSSDASRFTQTTPYATRPISPRLGTAKAIDSKPLRPATTSSGAGIETPAQKVARLRAAHLAKRAAQISTWDKVVVRGREIADKAHRWTVMAIVMSSVVLIGATGFTIGDMVRYNRQKKREFYETQSEILKQRFKEALEAEGRGAATEDQVALLREERDATAAAEAATEAKKNRPGIWKSMKDYVSRALDTNLSKEDRQYGERRQQILDRIEEHEKHVSTGTATEIISPTLQAMQDRRREVEKQMERQGVEPGPLDRLAEEATTKAQSKAKGWGSWFS